MIRRVLLHVLAALALTEALIFAVNYGLHPREMLILPFAYLVGIVLGCGAVVLAVVRS